MSREKLRVLLLPMEDAEPIWGEELVRNIGRNHDLRILDRSSPLEEQFADVEAVVDVGGVCGTRAMLDAAPKVRFWQIAGTGFEHFDLEYWATRPVMVSNLPGQMSAVALAEHALMFILLGQRRFPEAVENLHAGVMFKPLGRELPGQTLLCIGFGASARELSRRASAMGMRVIATDVVPVDEGTRDAWGADAVFSADRLDELLPEADVVSLHLHVNSETFHTLDERRLGLMKQTAFVVNVARGALVDEAAMVRAVGEGRLAGACTDVATEEPPARNSPLLRTQGVIVTPHTAGTTDGTARRRAVGVAENLDRVATGLEPLYRVDLLART